MRSAILIFFFFLLLSHLKLISQNFTTPSPNELIGTIDPFSYPSGNFRVCIVGDTGMGNASQRRVIADLEKQGCHQIRIPGDLIYPRGLTRTHDPSFQKKFQIPFKNMLDQKLPHEIDFFLVFGNHDYYGIPFHWFKKDKQISNLHIPDYFYFDKVGPICFFNFDTNVVNFILRKDQKANQLDWYKSIRAKYKNSCQASIGIGHHPYRSSGAHGPASGNLKEFFEEEISGILDIFVAGHEHHISYEGVEEKTHFFISGSGSKTRSVTLTEEHKKNKKFARPSLGYLILDFSLKGPNKKIQISSTFKELKKYKDQKTFQEVFKKIIFPQGIRSKQVSIPKKPNLLPVSSSKTTDLLKK